MSQAGLTFIRRSPGRYLATAIVVAIAYFLLAKLGLQLASINPSASPIWPPTGIALAAILLVGMRIWPAIFVAAFAANATTAGTLLTSAVIAGGNTLEAVVGGFLIGRLAGGAEAFDTPARVTKFVAICAGPAALISASIGVGALTVTGFADPERFSEIWVTWWLGDLAGALVVTPVVVLWARTDWRVNDTAESIATGIALAGALAVGAVAFSPLLPPSEFSSPLGFLAVLPLLWAALRCGPRDTATVALILTAFAIWANSQNAGPFRELDLNESFLLLLTFMISLSVPSLALSADVAARGQTEKALRSAQAELDHRVRSRTAALADANIQLREAQRIANLGSWTWDIAENRVSWSDQLFAIYGLTPSEFNGTVEQFLGFLHPEDRGKVEASIRKALAGGDEFSHEERIQRPDGSVRHLRSIGEVMRDENGTAVRMLGVCLDITEQRQAEHALRESEEGYRMLLEGVRDYAIYMLDTDGRVRSWNVGAARIKGYDAEEIIGHDFRKFYTAEDQAAGEPERALEVAARDGKYESQGWRVRKDGTRFYASALVDAIRDDDGDLIGFAKITRDITDQREAQLALEQTREQLAQAQKMEALGQLTGGIAHDFNNLLMIVSGYAQILLRRLTDARDRRAVEAIHGAAQRGERLTRQLLAFSRRQQLMPVVVDLRQRLDAVREMLAPSMRGNIEFSCDVEDGVWPVEVDLGEFELALVNIAVNARDAMPDGGTITLSARNVILGPGSEAGPLAGEFVALTVTDTGSGILPELLPRVFEPFFTTKPVGKGTGLGLSQVHGFAAQSGGSVTVSSQPGKGAAVTIYLPRSCRMPSATQEAVRAAVPRGGRGTILVVEDSREVADVTSALVEQLGYRVVRAESAGEALHHLQDGMHVDLVFSDVVMPGGMNGVALAEICRERFPQVPVLLTSGYSEATQTVDGGFEILRKPFELAALEEAIAAAVARGGQRARAG